MVGGIGGPTAVAPHAPLRGENNMLFTRICLCVIYDSDHFQATPKNTAIQRFVLCICSAFTCINIQFFGQK